ncbi:peptidylprolyl isomerase [Shimia sagamensis]|uniref:Parvulin-like PPIase n=1 Tax=Shimia sagamensis TaxID=1566352 RepID=A0ABY1NDA8_9RHOB|nr:peptidylprolyl isomerase [Shimia sagamensis]SMP05012.1 peptidyl-prolyl cis-trans isomerase C [Shimia sagamensis]
MSKHLNFLRASVIAICGALPAIAEESQSLDTVVATVNGEVITLGEMISVRAGLPEQYQSIPSDVLFGSILEQLVQQTALAQGLGEAIPQRVEIALNNERRTLLAAEALEAFVLQNNLSEDELRAAYDDKYQGFVGEEEFSASHILVPSEEEAKTIRKDLKDGADFAETAKAKSTGPSGASGGSLGWFGMGQMVKPFEEAVVGLAVGEISQPVQTQFGWHLILLNDARKSLAPSFEDAKAELESEAQRRAVEAFIATTTADAQVDQTGAEGIDPSVLTQIQLLNPNTAQDH